MFSILQFYEAGKARSGTALIPIFDTINMRLNISMRLGSYITTKGDGSVPFSDPFSQIMRDYTDGFIPLYSNSFSYSSAFTGNISLKFLKGLKDVYSIYLGEAIKQNPPFANANAVEKYNITDIETFFAQFPNLYSVRIREYAYQLSARMSIIKGDLAKFPNSVERVLIDSFEVINATTDAYLNFSSYTNASKLKYFYWVGSGFSAYNFKVTGDLGKLPTTCEYLNIQKVASGSSITYTSGKVWASSFDTLYLPELLNIENVDDLLNDMANSITSAKGAKSITIAGIRTTASDTSVSYLTGLGFNITITLPIYRKILDLPLQNSFADVSVSAISMVAGSGSGLPPFVAGRKGTDYAVSFGSSKYIKTSTNLPLNTSDKISISFWMKSVLTGSQAIMIYGASKMWIYANNTAANTVEFLDNPAAQNLIRTPKAVFVDWTHIVITSDRGLGKDQSKIYINKVETFVQGTQYADIIGNFTSEIMNIGNTLTGLIQEYKVFNYIIDSVEITELYNA